MDIKYGSSKDVKCYQNFVENPESREAMRNFSKKFGKDLMKPAKKLHDRLKQFISAGHYNAEYGNTDNRIEIKKGGKENTPLILKVRVGISQRKFFNHIIEMIEGEKILLLTKDWEGDFYSIKTIYVIDVNNHDYNKL